MGKLTHYYFSWIVSFQNREIYARFFLWRLNNPEVNYSLIRSLGGSVSRGNIKQQALWQEGLQRKEEGTSQPQDWNMECKNLESRRQIEK
jgi:hypothetical protein